VTSDHMSMEGQEFEEDSVLWKVIDVKYCKKSKVLVVWYYDVQKAREQGITEEVMIEARNAKPVVFCEPLEHSSVEEVRSWIAEDVERRNGNDIATEQNEDMERSEEEEEEDEESVPSDYEHGNELHSDSDSDVSSDGYDDL
jgi:hypothetical protein